jgi:hypothetical protein
LCQRHSSFAPPNRIQRWISRRLRTWRAAASGSCSGG